MTAPSAAASPPISPACPISIFYFVHDLADAAVERRVRMLQSARDLVLIGFRRRGNARSEFLGRQTVELGRTADASFVRRAFAVLRAALTARRWRGALAGADVVIARQLEMLALAVLTCRRGTPIVYECLDIHRLMLGTGLVGRSLRRIEAVLMRRCTALIVSSPAFISAYFGPRHGTHPPPLLLENKVLQHDLGAGPPSCVFRPAPPFRIGWFGILRCRRSLLALIDLVQRHPEKVEVVLRGRPSRTAIADFDTLIAGVPGLWFEGPYDRARDLAAIYADIDFIWAIDFFEYPGNSEWLLPNRLYEGTVFGCVPIALASVETGRWLARHHCGVLLGDPVEAELAAWIQTETAAACQQRRADVGRINLAAIIADPNACRSVVIDLREVATARFRSPPPIQD